MAHMVKKTSFRANVQTNKGKAKMVEEPRPTTYKEALQKHNSFSDD